MASRVERIIIKHYGKGKKFKTRGWEQCGNEIENLIESLQNNIKRKNFTYSVECKKCEKIRNKIESEFESYFKVGHMYNWLFGNSNLQYLLRCSIKCR